MSYGARGGRAVVLAASLILIGGSGVSAQDGTTTEPVGEAALCPVPDGADGGDGADSGEDGSTAQTSLIAAVDPLADPGFGCTFPLVGSVDPFTGETRPAHAFDDPLLPGIIRDTHIFEAELGRRELRDATRQRGVVTAGRLRPGLFTIVVIDHERIPADVGINVFTNLDDRPFNDVPTSPASPDVPIAGVDGGYSIFPGSPARVFVTDFRQGGEYYSGNVRDFPFAAMSGPQQTAFLIPADGVGTTVTPFVFANDAMHYIDILPNGALPVDGFVPLFPACLSQYVVHQPLVVAGQPVSASTDWLTSCFPVSASYANAMASTIGDQGTMWVGVSFLSNDPQANERRPQDVYAEVSVRGERLYVRFPSGLLQYGYDRAGAFVFEPTGDPILDGALGYAGATLEEYVVPIAVNESEGLIQGREECLRPGEQEQRPIG